MGISNCEGCCYPKLMCTCLTWTSIPYCELHVTDFEDCMAIVKMTDYNLLNPPVPKPHRKLVNHKVAMVETKKCKKLVLTELVDVCKQHLAEGKMVPEKVKPLNVVGLIKEWVEILCFQQKVGDIEKQMLTEFSDIFQPLPHVKKMPRNVMAKIKLKNME